MNFMPAVLPQFVVLAFAISFAAVAAIIFSVYVIIRRGKPERKFLDIVRDDNWYPSLALFQFITWTSVIAFLYLWVYLIRVFGGALEIPPAIPSNLLILMGISVAVPLVSGSVSTYKYGGAVKYRTRTPVERPEKPPKFWSMLQEGNKPSVPRFQMFVWTWVGVTIYLVVFIATITRPGALQAAEKLYLPDIDATLVILMGLSQGAYIGGKLVASESLEVTTIIPTKIKDGDIISLFGTNFGEKENKEDKGTVLFNNIKASKTFRGTKIQEWLDTRIDVKVEGLDPGIYFVEAVAGTKTPASQRPTFTVEKPNGT